MYYAIYFIMGNYNEDDDVDKNWIGLDWPFEDDSPILKSINEIGLINKIRDIYDGKGKFDDGTGEADFESDWPEVICDEKGNFLPELYKILGIPFDLHLKYFSGGRESLANLWERERWRFCLGND